MKAGCSDGLELVVPGPPVFAVAVEEEDEGWEFTWGVVVFPVVGEDVGDMQVDAVGGNKAMPPRTRDAYTVRLGRCSGGRVAAIGHAIENSPPVRFLPRCGG